MRWSKARPSWRSCSARSSAALPPRRAITRRCSARMIMVFALLCWVASLFIPRTGQGAPNLRVDPNIARSTGSLLRDLWIDHRLWWGGLVTSWFWLVGAVVLSLMPPLVKTVLGATEEVVTAYLAIFSIAIAVGSLLAAWLAHGRIVLFPTLGRRRAARRVRARSRLCDLRGDTGRDGRRRAGVLLVEGHPHRDRPRGPRDRRRPVHRAVVRGRAVLGRRRQARARGRRRQRAQRGVHRRRHA